MAQLTRNLFVPLLDVTRGKVEGTYDWKPIDLSTQFELAYNPNTDTKSYICYKNDTTVLSSYSPELPQEIALDSSSPVYAFLYSYMREMPVGTSAEFPVMVTYPKVKEDGSIDTASSDADVWEKALVTLDSLNTVDGVLTFNLALNGDPIKGTVTGLGTEKVTFTKAAQGA